MRKKYLKPEMEVTLVRIEGNLLTSGQGADLTNDSSYLGYDEDEFWS